MAGSVTVLCPNARRVVVRTSPYTSVLQILEEACAKFNYDPDLYTLKHAGRPLDVSCSVRLSALPNRCLLEMQELPQPRPQGLVTICLLDPAGAKHVSQHLPAASLWSVVSGLAEGTAAEATVLYGLQRISGRGALEATTLRSLGLSGGSASLRLLLQQSDDQQSAGQLPASNQRLPEVIPVEPQLPEVIPVEPQMPEVIPVEPRMPEVIPMEPQMPEVIPVEPQMPEVISEAPQMPEVIPIEPQMPEVIPVEPQMPEVIPIEPQMPEVIAVEPQMPEVIPEAPQMPEVIPASDQIPRHENVSEFSCPEDVSGAAMDTSEEPFVLHNDVEPLRSDAVHVAAGRNNPKSPDVVTSSTAAPDVVMTKNDPMPRPPDVLAAESARGDTSVEAFSGRGHSVEAFSGQGHCLSPTGPSVPQAPQQSEDLCPSQYMDVDSTQDLAIAELTRRGAVVFDAGDETAAAPPLEEDDSFYELSVDDVKLLHRQQLQQMQELAEAPLLTQELRSAQAEARLLAALRSFPVTLLRICFPGGVVVQARFRPTDEVQDVAVFVSSLLKDESLEFDLLNMFPRVPLSRVQTLHAAGLVPRARLLFTPHGRAKLLPAADLLKASVLSQLASYQRAQDALQAASSRNDSASCSSTSAPISAPSSSDAPISSSSSSGAVPKRPKWFKLGKQ